MIGIENGNGLLRRPCDDIMLGPDLKSLGGCFDGEKSRRDFSSDIV